MKKLELLRTSLTRYKEMLSISAQHEQKSEQIIPDTSPDVLSIAFCNASCRISEKRIAQDRLFVTGTADISVFYYSEEDKLCNVSCQMPIAFDCEAPGCNEQDLSVVHAQLASVVATTINPRKLELSLSLCFSCSAYCCEQLGINSGVVGDGDEGINILTNSEKVKIIAAIAQKNLNFSEEIRMASGEISPSDKLLRCEITWRSEDVKVMTNKVMLRGSVLIKAITMSENGMFLNTSSYTLPFSQVLDCDKADAGDFAEIRYCPTVQDFKLFISDEGAVYLNCDIGCTITALMCRDVTVDTMSDIYSSVYHCESTAEAVMTPDCGEYARCDVDVDCVFDCEAARIKDYTFSACAQSSMGMLRAKCHLRILYEGKDGQQNMLQRAIDVEHAPSEVWREGVVKLSLQNCEIGIDGDGNITVALSGAFEGQLVGTPTGVHVTTCKLDKSKPRQQRAKGTVILRAIEPGENLWSVAKQYGVSRESIAAANRLGDEAELMSGKLIMIPFSY